MLNITKLSTSPKEKFSAQARVYIWPEGEDIMDNLVNRRSRPGAMWKALAERALVLLAATNSIEGLTFSQYAGCKCGCSPGVVIRGSSRVPFDIHLTVTA